MNGSGCESVYVCVSVCVGDFMCGGSEGRVG